jgi:hypothetical protein
LDWLTTAPLAERADGKPNRSTPRALTDRQAPRQNTEIANETLFWQGSWRLAALLFFS